MTGQISEHLENGDRGFALINVLVIVLALSILAIQLIRDTNRGAELTAVSRAAEQATLLSDAGLLFARRLLTGDAHGPDIDHSGEAWALDGFVTKTGGAAVTIWVHDLQARFNLNLMISDQPAAPEAAFTALATSMGAPAELASALAGRYKGFQPNVAQVVDEATQDMFLDGDVVQIGTVADLLTPQAIPLRRHISALPRGSRVNVNTAGPDVLAAVLGLDTSEVSGLIALRKRTPFDSVEAFLAVLEQTTGAATVAGVQQDLLTVETAWFSVDTQVTVDSLTHRGTTMLFRDPGTGELRTVARSVEVTR